MTLTTPKAKKLLCKQGHELSGDNVRISKRGWRVCVICSRKYSSQSKKKRRHNARAAGTVCI